jgi:hypothetical protein
VLSQLKQRAALGCFLIIVSSHIESNGKSDVTNDFRAFIPDRLMVFEQTK